MRGRPNGPSHAVIRSISVRSDLLVLLDERRAKAAVAWQYVTRHKDGRKNTAAGDALVEAFAGCWYSPEEWMCLAGLSPYDHSHVAPFLFRASAVGPDGSVSDEAMVYARRLTAGRLGAKPKRDESPPR